MLRKEHANIKDLLAVVTRLQKGEENLAKQGVNVTSYVAINNNFVKEFSKDPERALEYQAGPDKWAENYIRENGVGAFVEFFDPGDPVKKENKLDRAKKFLQRYEKVLRETGQIAQLEMEVIERYGQEMEDIFIK
jgi:hypothetical protein